MFFDSKEGQESQWCPKRTYRNPSLGLATKTRACEGAGQERAQESHLMLLRV